MFSKLMNRFYYGKSGKGDYTPSDLPKNRRELFLVTFRTRFGSLIVLNLVYLIFYLPTFIVLLSAFSNWTNALYSFSVATREPGANNIDALAKSFSEYQHGLILSTLIKLIPCIFITGPANVGIAYDLRNWARDEHAFIWSDMWDSIKANWKQAIGISAINAVLPALLYIGFRFYGSMASKNTVMVVPQLLLIMIAFIWFLASGFFNFLIITYNLKFFDVIRNGVLLSIARLPYCILIKLLNLMPIIVSGALCYFVNLQVGLLVFIVYYALIGLTLSRFINASLANACFEKLINPKIEGARSNIGLRQKEYDELDEELYKQDKDDNAVYIEIDKEK